MEIDYQNLQKNKKKLLQGSIDILMLNHYSSNYIKNQEYDKTLYPGWIYDQNTEFYYTNQDGNLIGTETKSSWLHITPFGIKNLLIWLQNRYTVNKLKGFNIKRKGKICSLELMITENGVDLLNENETSTYEDVKNDYLRSYYIESYLTNIKEAVIQTGIKWKGYYVWSLLDNFEWTNEYKCRFGITYIQISSETNQRVRLLKNSALWYKEYIKNNP